MYTFLSAGGRKEEREKERKKERKKRMEKIVLMSVTVKTRCMIESTL